MAVLAVRSAVRPYRGVSARVRVRGLPGLTTTHRLVFRCLVGHCPGPHQAYFARPLSPLDTRNIADIAVIAVAVQATVTRDRRDEGRTMAGLVSRLPHVVLAGSSR